MVLSGHTHRDRACISLREGACPLDLPPAVVITGQPFAGSTGVRWVSHVEGRGCQSRLLFGVQTLFIHLAYPPPAALFFFGGGGGGSKVLIGKKPDQLG